MMDTHSAAELIRESFPDISPDDVFALAQTEDLNELAEKNALAHKLIMLSQPQNLFEKFFDVPEDIEGLYNPCYRASVSPESRPVTYLELCAESGDYRIIYNSLKDMPLHEIYPCRMESVLRLEDYLPRLKADLFKTKKDVLKPYENHYIKLDDKEVNRRIFGKRKDLDCLLGVIAKKFPDKFKPLLEKLFESPKTGAVSFDKEYVFDKQTTPHSVLSFLMSAKMPQTALCLLDAVNREQGAEGVLPLLQGAETKQAFKGLPYFKAVKEGGKEKNTVFQVKKHLEEILPSKMFLEHVEFKPAGYSWQADFSQER